MASDRHLAKMLQWQNLADEHITPLNGVMLNNASDYCANGLIIIITSEPQAGAWPFPRVASIVLCPGQVAMLS